MNWYIGQSIVVLEDDGAFIKEGEIYEILGLNKGHCKCNHVGIDIGKFYNTVGSIKCDSCKTTVTLRHEKLFFHESWFKPLDELADISELTEILETKQPFEL